MPKNDRRVQKPYSYPDDIPGAVKNQSPGVQRAFISAFNSAYQKAIKQGKSASDAEALARKAGWANVKRNFYRDTDGKWKAKKTKNPLLDTYKGYQDLPHDVQQLPTFGIMLWASTYNASDDRKLTKRCDRAWDAVKKMYFFDPARSRWSYKKRIHGRKRQLAGKLKAALESHRRKRDLTFGKGESNMAEATKEKRKGFFKVWLPFDEDHAARIEKGDKGKKFLVGIASSSSIDRDGEIMAPEFVRKMAKQAPGLAVFIEHQHHLSESIGYVESSHMVGDRAFEARTALEPEWDPETKLGNQNVSTVLMKLEHGTPLGYSIAGYVTKFEDKYYEELDATIPTALDGEIDELSVTARPSNRESNISIAKAIKELRGRVDEEDDDERGRTKFRHTSNTDESEPNWGDVEKKSLPRIAHAVTGEPNKKATWKYPHHHIKSGGSKNDIGVFTTGTMFVNKGGVNAAWATLHGARSGERGPADAMAHVNKHRKALGIDKSIETTDLGDMVKCSIEFAFDHWDVCAELEKSLMVLAPAILLLKQGRLGKNRGKILAKTIAKATSQVEAGLAVKVVSDLYGMEDYQQEG